MIETGTVPIRALQVVDALATGGAERMAIMLANDLADVTERSALCATRVLGPLASSVSPAVRTTCLERRGRIGFRSIGPLRSLISNERINVVQAHGSSDHSRTSEACS